MTGLHIALAALVDEWQANYDRWAGVSDGPRVGIFRSHANRLRALLDEHPADLPVATGSTTADGSANDCTHVSASGVDRTPIGPDKVWRCDHCGLCWRQGPGNPTDDTPAPEPSDRAGLSETEPGTPLGIDGHLPNVPAGPGAPWCSCGYRWDPRDPDSLLVGEHIAAIADHRGEAVNVPGVLL
ncbi:hypothetical protein [Pimelobacter simplex]|uniref:hypothetical protein n=1 Tax=Nocardioides simplex TaxID=2045 RepID=UPI0021505873|nr:hypothetical protein [Pimelobacter simplex]UUW88377.1 hypothetical protein M0M43_21895 [Pimelobacter simplex]UUW97881.1 hypothetical protein M0M48_10540 [Pimelobacter simplex]